MDTPSHGRFCNKKTSADLRGHTISDVNPSRSHLELRVELHGANRRPPDEVGALRREGELTAAGPIVHHGHDRLHLSRLV